jgi:hypothetical protein
MKKEDRTRHQLVPDETAQEAHRKFAKRPQCGFGGSGQSPKPLKMTLPGDLALFLDEILKIAEKHKGKSRADTLAEIVDLGILAWCADLDEEIRDSLGLPSVDALRREKAGWSQDLLDAKQREEALKAELSRIRLEYKEQSEQLLAERESIRAEVIRLKQELEFLDEQSHFNSDRNQAQPGALLYEDTFSGYTPMTSHAFAAKIAKNGAPAPKTQPANGNAAENRRSKHRARRRRPRGPSQE